MYRTLLAINIAVFSFSAQAQMSPVGNWHTVDEKTGEVKSEIRVTDNGGTVTGAIAKLLRKDVKQDQVCDQCTDDRKAKTSGKTARSSTPKTAKPTACA
jgi:hypothetical protein